ncbi:MAG: substrate-binding domain-containing protein [Candidatus Parvarchaeota archaeon]
MCASDVLAVGAIKWLIKSGLKVPDDVAVTGFDGVDIVNLVTPSITTIEQPRT